MKPNPDRATRHVRTWILEPGAAPRPLFDRRQQDAYKDPGSPLAKYGGAGGRGGAVAPGGGGGGPILQVGDAIYLSGQGATPDGDRPFLDRLDLKTLNTERVFRADEKTFEMVITPIDPQAKTFVRLDDANAVGHDAREPGGLQHR